MQNRKRPVTIIIVLFVIINALLLTGRRHWERLGADVEVVLFGNLALFIITLLSYYVARRGLHQSNPHAFVRSVFGSITVKLFACMIAALFYIASYRSALNKPALFTLMALYLIYTFIEVGALTRLLRQQRNG